MKKSFSRTLPVPSQSSVAFIGSPLLVCVAISHPGLVMFCPRTLLGGSSAGPCPSPRASTSWRADETHWHLHTWNVFVGKHGRFPRALVTLATGCAVCRAISAMEVTCPQPWVFHSCPLLWEHQLLSLALEAFSLGTHSTHRPSVLPHLVLAGWKERWRGDAGQGPSASGHHREPVEAVSGSVSMWSPHLALWPALCPVGLPEVFL